MMFLTFDPFQPFISNIAFDQILSNPFALIYYIACSFVKPTDKNPCALEVLSKSIVILIP
jgi:hypothetical protein